MKTRDTGDSLVVETGVPDGNKGWWASNDGITWVLCADPQALGNYLYARHNGAAVNPRTPYGNPAYKLSPRVPPPNLQRFEPAGRGPCGFCGEAALLDKLTGFCCACARVWVLGRP